MSRGLFVLLSILAIAANCLADDRPPNLVILFADDLGYGDLGCYGHPTIRTPNLDRMAAEGMRFTQFYSSSPVCTPSRAALLTGRLPIRSGMCHDRRRVLFADSTGGLPNDEVTIAELLKGKGYATCCIGKWHLGHRPEFLPMRHGFDSYFGLPYSNDMGGVRRGIYQAPLMRGAEIIEQPAVQETLTQRYTDEAVRFIRDNVDRPFLLYLPYTFPHVPLYASESFRDQSPRGLYGDVVEELDGSVGQLRKAIAAAGLAERTLVFFTSDNGPWLIKGAAGGSAGLLRDGKGSTFEGGMREPALAVWPGTIAPGSVCRAIAGTVDLLPTAAQLAGVPLPADRVLDGQSLLPALSGQSDHVRDTNFYYRGTRLMAVRHGPWKAHFYTQPAYDKRTPVTQHEPPLLYNLDVDPGEQYDLSQDHPETIETIRDIAARHTAGVEPAPSQLE